MKGVISVMILGILRYRKKVEAYPLYCYQQGLYIWVPSSKSPLSDPAANLRFVVRIFHDTDIDIQDHLNLGKRGLGLRGVDHLGEKSFFPARSPGFGGGLRYVGNRTCCTTLNQALNPFFNDATTKDPDP